MLRPAHRPGRLPARRRRWSTRCWSTTRPGCAGRSRTRCRPSWSGRWPTGPASWCSASAFPDRAVVDRATAAFEQLIAEQQAGGAVAGDHFAPPGANDRVWNALEKLAVAAPEVFVDYYANDILALVATAWLGPGYQVTSQLNVVNPGGQAQVGHRDYHLGFLPNAVDRALPGARAPAVPGAHPAGRGGAFGHAAGERPDAVPAALAEVRARLPGREPARVRRVLRARTTCSCRCRPATPRSSTRR